jgi:hypothetical protein
VINIHIWLVDLCLKVTSVTIFCFKHLWPERKKNVILSLDMFMCLNVFWDVLLNNMNIFLHFCIASLVKLIVFCVVFFFCWNHLVYIVNNEWKSNVNLYRIDNVRITWKAIQHIDWHFTFCQPFLSEHIVKNGRVHWKASCYKFKLLWNYEKCFNTNQTWHKCWLAISFVTTCSVWNFLLPWQRGDISKLPKITILPRFFFHQNLFQSAATSQGIEIESKAFQRWLHVT